MHRIVGCGWLILLGSGFAAELLIACGSGDVGSADATSPAGGTGGMLANTSGVNSSAPTMGAGAMNGGAAPVASSAGAGGDAPDAATVDHPDDPCGVDGGCAPGLWVDVTPPDVNLTDPLDCANFGTETVQVDPAHPEQIYALFSCQGIWKSTDYGQTWHGPINSPGNSKDCAGGIAIAPNDTASPPTIYQSCIRGTAGAFSRSTNGGVDWTQFTINVAGSNGQFYPPAIDPYDPKHLIIVGHYASIVAESNDGGETWALAPTPSAMTAGVTGSLAFINTGDPATTHDTWLWIAQTNGTVGTWRTTQGTAGGADGWTRVEGNSHPAGIAQIYQPDTKGVVFMAGLYSTLGNGILRSPDYGAHWSHVGDANLIDRVVVGTPNNVYALNGNEVDPETDTGDPALQIAPQPGLVWTSYPRPPGMMRGPLQANVTYDGKNYILLVANWSGGIWRYVEP